MEILELQNRIKKTLELVNNARSISAKRRYFVYLSCLVSTYSHITGSDVILGELDNRKIMKTTFYENFVEEINDTSEILFDISDGILNARKEIGCEFREQFFSKTYGRKYLDEILESFLGSLGSNFYKLYKEAKIDGRLFYNQSFSEGVTIFDYERLKSSIFLPYDGETIPFLLTTVHELGHVFDYDYTKYSRKAIFTNKYNVNIETFSMFMELILIDYLKKINFDSKEIKIVEEKYYNDVVGFASEINFALSLPLAVIDYDFKLVLCDHNEIKKCYDDFVQKYGIDYITSDINLEDSLNYMYGGTIATIYEHYYNQDKSFLKDICKHFLDYESFTTEETLKRLPFVKEEFNGYPILRKKLEQIKTNQV